MYKKRQRRIEIIRQRLLRKRWPRFQVSLIIMLTGFTGFLTSFILLQWGLDEMAVRYPIAIAVAYFAFLAFLALWLWLQRHELPVDGDLIVEVVGRTSETHPFHFGGGGNFSGGGAGGSLGGGGSDSVKSAGSSLANAFDLDLDELWLLVLAAAALLGGLLSTFYVIYIAPGLLAEILVDGALLAGLYRRVKRIDERHWLRAAVRRTVLPAALVALFFSVAGFAMHHAVPNAHTMGDVLQHVTR